MGDSDRWSARRQVSVALAVAGFFGFVALGLDRLNDSDPSRAAEALLGISLLVAILAAAWAVNVLLERVRRRNQR